MTSRHLRFSALVILGLILLFSLVSCGHGKFFPDPSLSSITITPPSPSVLTGNTQQFNAVGTFSDGSTKVLSDATWSTSNAAVLLVNANGLATAVKEGSATVNASSGTAVGSTTVSVVTSPLTTINVTPVNPTVSLAGTKTQQFAATGVFSDGSSRDISSGVTWSSDNTQVATVSTTGLATGLKVGTATIKATSGTITGSSTLTVNQ